MSDFSTETTVTARKARRCPECRSTIKVGEPYRKIAGRWDGDFFSATMCTPCAAFAERYLKSLHQSSWLNANEVSYRFGELIDEAAEHVGHEDWKRSLPERRDAIMAMFDAVDEAERAYQRQERDNATRAKAVAERASLNRKARRQLMIMLQALDEALEDDEERASSPAQQTEDANA